MTTDAELHIMGTKFSHFFIPYGLLAIGYFIDSVGVMSASIGMFLVLLFSNIRTIPTYRGRVKEGDSE